jgi:hypothetical protein
MAYFVKRRDKTGTVINTLCRSIEEAMYKANTLRADGIECSIEDGDGNPIGDTMLKIPGPPENRGRSLLKLRGGPF